MIFINKEKINAIIMALYIFQFGFLQSIAIVVKSQLPIAVFTLILLFVILLNNNFQIKRYVLGIFLIISVYFLFSALVIKDSTLEILPLYLEFVIKSFSAFIIGSMDTEGNLLFDAFIKVSFINFIILLALPILGLEGSIGYMRYGYAMAPSVLIFSYLIYSNKNINLTWLILTIISMSFTLIYGSRGPLVVFILFILFIFLFKKGINVYKKSILIASSGLIMFFNSKYNLLLKLLDYIYINLNIKTYALAKFRMMIIQGIAKSSSGRDTIYSLLFEYIQKSPAFGNGVGFSNVSLGMTAHNIFLQILLESGILGLILWIIVWVYCYIKLNHISHNNDEGFFRITVLIISLALGRLLVSSDMWIRPEYWFALSMLINYNHDKDKTIKV